MMVCTQCKYFILLAAFANILIFVHVDGHGICANRIQVAQELNGYHRSFKHLDNIGVQQCMRQCKRYKKCATIDYDRELLTCDLMMAYDVNGDVTSLLDLNSLEIDNQSCSPARCSETEVCTNMKDESHTCIREDFCPTMEWLPFNGICYLFLEELLNADNNLERCASMNASMVRVEDAAVHLTLQQEMARRGITQIWIAANERGTKNHWVWGPGDPVVNEGWAPGEPFGFNKECVILKTNGWNDVNCVNFVSNAVCEASAL